MKVLNITSHTTVTKDLKITKTFREKSLGLLNPRNSRSLLIKTRFGIHTLFLKEAIDIIMLDKNLYVKVIKTLHPNSIYVYNPIYQTVLELPNGSIKKSKTKIGDKLKMLK